LAAPQTTGKIPAISSRFWSPKPANLPLSNQPLGFGPVGEAALVASPRPSPDAVRRAQAEARHDSLSLRVQAPVGDPGGEDALFVACRNALREIDRHRSAYDAAIRRTIDRLKTLNCPRSRRRNEAVTSDRQRRAKSLFSVAVAGPLEDGNNTYQRGDYAAAMRLLRPLALQGDADAQFKVGVMYDQGWGVPQNYTLALAWFREAAQQGVAGAQFNLAVMYAAGRDVARDEAEAALWYHEAAEQGNVAAQNNLGAMYETGPGRAAGRRAGPRVVSESRRPSRASDGSSASSGSRYVVKRPPETSDQSSPSPLAYA
jgi:hypothetical protein